jgi:hypothetical protein
VWLPALGAPTLVFLVALAALRRQRRRPLALAAPLALALTICFEAVLLNVLSAFGAVARGPLLASHAAALLAAGLALRAGRGRRLRLQWRPGGTDALAARALVAVLAAPIAYSALWYLPNNWDSMTYHLARVAHWVQHRSVGPYQTSVVRQVTLPPGAEYLLTVLQAIAGTDRLANLVQLASWMVAAFAAQPLARLFGAPRRIAPWAALVFAAAPMATLQASSTQNDLVASALAVAIVVACLPFLHRRARWRALDLALASAVLSAGLLVKPTALVAAAPFLLWAAIAAARTLARDPRARRALAAGVVSGLLVAAIVVGPELSRRAAVSGYRELGPYLYPPLSEGPDRALNVLRGVARHVPLPAEWSDSLAAATTQGCPVPSSMCAHVATRANEDVAGNPASTLLVAALLLAGLARSRSLPVRAKGALVSLPCAWVLFCALFRDNLWIARLHLPLFALAPLGAAALSGLPSRRFWLRWTAPAAAALLGALGARATLHNELRPVPNPLGAWFGLLPASYYAARRELWPSHLHAMAAIASSGCNRLGLLIGGDSYDYPITWRAMRRGLEVRHVTGSDPWPCVLYSDRGPPPPAPGGSWCPSPGSPEVFVRRRDAGGGLPCADVAASR